MGYCTVADLRGEGVTDAQAADVRLELLIDEASQTIDNVTGWFFEPRQMTLRLDGRGTPSLWLPYPPISVTSVLISDYQVDLDTANLLIEGAPVQPGFTGPRIAYRDGRVWPKNRGNIQIRGLWGYTEPDGTDYGRTPLEIRRACMLLVLRMIPPLADVDESADARNRWRIIEEKTRDQSYKLDKLASASPITGDPEIDSILMRYRQPMGLGVV